MLFIALALSLNLMMVSYRSVRFPSRVRPADGRYWLPLATCLGADLMASYGFFTLFQVAPIQSGSYTGIITALALVAAVIIIGKFAFCRPGASRRQRLLSWASSMLLIVVLYLLFGSIAYFSTIIRDYDFAPLIYTFIPAVMLSILWINTIYDHWDYADQNE